MATMVSKPDPHNTPKAAPVAEDEESDSEGTIATMVSKSDPPNSSTATPIEVDLTAGNESDPGDDPEEDVAMPDLEDIPIIDNRQRPTEQWTNYWQEKSTYADTESPEGMLDLMDHYTTARTKSWWMETPEAERAKKWTPIWYQIQKLGHRYWGTYIGHNFRKYLLQLTPPQLAKAADNKSKRNNLQANADILCLPLPNTNNIPSSYP